MVATKPHVKLFLNNKSCYLLSVTVYDDLRDKLDRNEKGWVEYSLFEHPSGKAFFKLEDVDDLLYATEEWCKMWDEYEEEKRMDKIRDGGD